MDTTLSDGQNLIMDKLSYRFHEPERYVLLFFRDQKNMENIRII